MSFFIKWQNRVNPKNIGPSSGHSSLANVTPFSRSRIVQRLDCSKMACLLSTSLTVPFLVNNVTFLSLSFSTSELHFQFSVNILFALQLLVITFFQELRGLDYAPNELSRKTTISSGFLFNISLNFS